MTRSRVDHTGLNSTLFLMGNRNNENCDNCGVKENAEHVILDCILYEVERQVLQNRVQGSRFKVLNYSSHTQSYRL